VDYIKHITIPRNTTKENPVKEQIILPKGVIKQVGYFFPSGCAGLAHLTIWKSTVQQWPRSQDFSYYGDNLYRDFPEDFELPDAYNILIFKCWNIDDTWPHTLTVHITVLLETEPSWVQKLLWGLIGGS